MNNPNRPISALTNNQAMLQAELARIQELTARYESARQSIAQFNPAEVVEEFGPLPTARADCIDVCLAANRLDEVVVRIEARAQQLEQEHAAKMPESKRLLLRIESLEARVAMLEGRSAAPRSTAPRTAQPQLLVPTQGAGGAGLGGVSYGFDAPSAVHSGGVRRVGGG